MAINIVANVADRCVAKFTAPFRLIAGLIATGKLAR
jgi:hypothetical protein